MMVKNDILILDQKFEEKKSSSSTPLNIPTTDDEEIKIVRNSNGRSRGKARELRRSNTIATTEQLTSIKSATSIVEEQSFIKGKNFNRTKRHHEKVDRDCGQRALNFLISFVFLLFLARRQIVDELLIIVEAMNVLDHERFKRFN